MRLRTLALVCFVAAVAGLAPAAHARQSQGATPETPRAEDPARADQEPVRVFTQEVKLPVVAYDDRGNFDPALEPDDVLVREDGVPQRVRSVSRVPSNLLLVFDTSAQVTATRSSHLASRAALLILSSMRPGDRVAIIQNSDSVTVLQDWTEDVTAAAAVVRTKLLSARRSRLSECLTAAAAKLRERPGGGTHVVVFTDGLEAQSSGAIRAEEIKAEAVLGLASAQAAVHLFCFATMVGDVVRHRNSPVSVGGGGNSVKVIVDTDREMRRWFRDYARAAEARKEQLMVLARETGGRVLLPATAEEVTELAEKFSRDLAAQYVVSYTPKLLLGGGERRKIEVSSRRLGLQLFSLRASVVAPQE